MKSPSALIKNTIQFFFLAVLCFCMGDSAARIADKNPLKISSWEASVPTSSEGNWGLSFQQEGKPPVGNATSDYLKDLDRKSVV